MSRKNLTRYAWLSLVAALVTMGIKALAWRLTGSVGVLSDALESIVNLAGAMMSMAMLSVAARPEDDEHPYGHGKAEYFSSGVEGTLILLAAGGIAFAAVRRLLHPSPLQELGTGLLLVLAASVVNLGVAIILFRAGKRHHSITLETSAHHLLTDVWTSVAVLAGIGAVMVTGLQWLDPVIALGVAANIVWTGGRIVFRSVMGLMDSAVSSGERADLQRVLEPYLADGVQYHALRTRQAGVRRFVSLHVLVPGEWTVRRGHALLERIEGDIRRAVPNASVLTHLEAVEDPAAWEDQALDRPTEPERP